MLELEKIAALKRTELVNALNNLIETDFQSLIQLLYRIDINETKLKQKLQDYKNQDAGEIIADMIAERLAEKERLRKSFQQQPPLNDAEKW
jgi:hypothetical protein